MRRLLLVSALLACPVSALADPPAGQIDPTFGDFDGGVLGLQLEGLDVGGDYDDFALGMAADAQGRLLVAGRGETDDGPCLGLMRFTSDGQLDKSDFGYNENNVAKGKTCHVVPLLDGAFSFDTGMNIALLSDGGFLVSGVTDEISAFRFVCRFLANGNLSESFGAGTGCVRLDHISAPPILVPHILVWDSSIIIVANHLLDNDRLTPAISRIDLSTGALQPFGEESFLTVLPSHADAVVVGASLTPDGALIAVGGITEDTDDVDAFIARFDMRNLAPDLSFSGDGMVRLKVNKVPKGANIFSAVTVLPNGNILAAGEIELTEGQGLTLIQVDSHTGVMEPSFNGGLPKTYNPCTAIDVGCSSIAVNAIGATDDHVIVTGKTDDQMFAARLTSDGRQDSSFGAQGLTRFDFAENNAGMALQEDRVVLAGSVFDGDSFDFGLLRLSGGRLFKDQFEAGTP